MGFSKKAVTALVLPPMLALGSLAVATVAPGVAGASTSHSMMTAHTWKGKVGMAHAMMGGHGSFSFVIDMKTYTVDYSAMTKFEMGNAKMLKAGTSVTVTGTLKGKVITATKLNI